MLIDVSNRPIVKKVFISAWMNSFRWLSDMIAVGVVCLALLLQWCRLIQTHNVVMTVSALLALCEGNPTVTGGFPSRKANKAELWYVHCFLLAWTSCWTNSWGADDLKSHNYNALVGRHWRCFGIMILLSFLLLGCHSNLKISPAAI